MSEIEKVAEDYFAQYDDVAVGVLEDDETVVPKMAMTPMQMSVQVMELMGWEEFDLLEDHAHAAVYDNGTAPEILASAHIASLRKIMFQRALVLKIGLPGVNNRLIAFYDMWAAKLYGKWNAQREGVEATPPRWIN